MSEAIIVGIDLGTTFSAIAYVNSYGKPEIIPNLEGERTTPSVIFFEDDGTPIVGQIAFNQAITNPERTVRFVKRQMGNPSFRFNVDGEDYLPETLSAIILKKLKNDAEERLGKEIKKAVISVPAYFKDAQREATKQAAEIAGLEVIRIINEPTAAALAYGLDKEEDQTILIYDFGGGTFDVTILKVAGREFTVLATDGDPQLGGSDVDAVLVKYLAEDFKEVHNVDLREQPHTNQDLWQKAEITKKDVGVRPSVKVVLSHGGNTASVNIDRDDFEDLIEDLINKTETYMKKVIRDAKMDWSDIDKIILVGGSSRIPAVQKMIKRVTGKEPVKDTNPDECVALGAAIQAVVAAKETQKDSNGKKSTEETPELKSDKGESVDLVINEVASHSLGIQVKSAQTGKYINSIIIPRLTQIPCERTKIYTTLEDNQSRVDFDVLQGEDEDPRSPNIDRIGKTGLKNLPPCKAGELKIEVTLKYTADGIIEVVTREQMSGQVSRESIMQKSGILADDIVEASKQKLEAMEI
ncbi:MAG: Hsp70 family protein [Microcystis sp. M54BS1]|uniref:Hsp70 family protein n=1 Tax=Microcystis TaxID=1125 RepID=UPI001230C30F|nr:MULTISPECIES: Hsp70 family protein [Microcystis]MCA2538041.1 Hsp70 family protein [Microcystis sp. M54BS1]MCA2595098.1 Hsp70 family protein [Microcystis sp. M38BS1]MCA2608828.1 Hsp70 family protein [Microcystis sp. M27BS1]MCA2506035.1 Hsp70 family protein [Microcystis sp. M62BS1]MCA2509057.1 Hsp70 family protein [Microcystis sp. M60BS1]